MLGHAVARNPASALRNWPVARPVRIGPIAFGNAIGDSIAEANKPVIKTLSDVGGTPIQRLTQPDLRTMDVPELNLQGLENLRLPSIGDGLTGGGSGSLAALPASQVMALIPQVIDAPLVPSTSAGVTRLERVEVTGTGGYTYADGRGASIGDRIAGDGTRVRLYADGYSTSALDGSVSFKRADMSGLGVSTPLGGSALSAAEYEGVTDRAAWLNSNYDSPSTWHDIKATVDGWFGITPKPSPQFGAGG